MQSVFQLTCLCLCGVIGISQAAGADGHWSAGAASVKITPDGPVWMAGYAARDKPSEGVAQDLFAKSLVLRDQSGQVMVIVTLDLISVPGPLRKHVEGHLFKTRQLGPERLLMNCSHTHCGPEIRTTGTALAGLSPERRAASLDYVNALQTRILESIDLAFGRLGPARVFFQQARAGFAMNRRLLSDGRYINHPNPDGRVDHDVPVLRVESGDSLVAIVFGYACHNTTLGFYQLCGDYAGFAQEELERRHPGTVAMFMMGCGGDQNPYPRRTLELARTHGHTLATAVEAALTTRKQEVASRIRAAFGTAALKYADAPSRQRLLEQAQSSNKYDRRYAERLLADLNQHGQLLTEYPAPVQTVQFGDEVLLIALPGETVVDYSLRLKRELKRKDGPAVWVAGYSNDVFAYIPSLRVLQEGGYEAGGAMRYMTTVVQPGPFAADVEDRLISRVEALLREIGAAESD